jgi:hypothetical protein
MDDAASAGPPGCRKHSCGAVDIDIPESFGVGHDRTDGCGQMEHDVDAGHCFFQHCFILDVPGHGFHAGNFRDRCLVDKSPHTPAIGF